jgi:hypothetical protein
LMSSLINVQVRHQLLRGCISIMTSFEGGEIRRHFAVYFVWRLQVVLK